MKKVKLVFGSNISDFAGELIDVWREENWRKDSNRLILESENYRMEVYGYILLPYKMGHNQSLGDSIYRRGA